MNRTPSTMYGSHHIFHFKTNSSLGPILWWNLSVLLLGGRCGHCKRLAPEFDKAAGILKTNDPPVTLVTVDCTADGGKDTCSKYGVSGYPTLKIFRNGEVSQEYNGPREAG